jgi:dUTPase
MSGNSRDFIVTSSEVICIFTPITANFLPPIKKDIESPYYSLISPITTVLAANETKEIFLDCKINLQSNIYLKVEGDPELLRRQVCTVTHLFDSTYRTFPISIFLRNLGEVDILIKRRDCIGLVSFQSFHEPQFLIHTEYPEN